MLFTGIHVSSLNKLKYHVEFLYLNNKRNYDKYKKLMDRYTDDFQPAGVKGIKSF